MISVFNPSAKESSTHWNWVTLAGPDAKDFLHRLTTANVKMLQPGLGRPACFLTPQGKIRAYFTLWNYLPNEYAFEFDSGISEKWKSELLTVIDQFTFGEKITLTDVTPQLECRWIFLENEAIEKTAIGQIQPGETKAIDEEIRVCHHGDRDYGRTWISVWGRPARLALWMEHFFPQVSSTGSEVSTTIRTVRSEDLEKWRIEALAPKMDREITQESSPLEIGLKDAIAENKGCYPGQEVIEKIIALGSPAKRLVRIEGHGTAPTLGEMAMNLATPPAEVGQVTSLSSSESGYKALAIVKKIHAKDGLEVRFSQTQNTIGVIAKVAGYE